MTSGAVGLVAHEARPAAIRLAERTADWLAAAGRPARVLGADADPSAAEGLDLAVSLGGDGTMLRTVRLVGPAGVPVLGVNLGHLGYLTAVEPNDLPRALERFLAGEHRIDARMTLDVRVGDGSSPGSASFTALNDVVLQRPAGGHTVRVGVSVGGRRFLGFAADAVIVATPTGSTAYNLSARGPIVSPRARVLVLTPVAPHSLFDRSVVVDGGERIALTMDDDRSAELVVDGMAAGAVKPGQVVEVTGGRFDARLVIFEERDFEGILLRKFNLPGG